MIFCHSLRSDWNHGNAHFLRGVATELLGRGHDVVTYEARDNWSVKNLVEDAGTDPLHKFQATFPDLRVRVYEPGALDLDEALAGADVVLVHEWNDPALVARIGQHKAKGQDYTLLFHDTHHRAATKPKEMAKYDLQHYDGVLAFGNVIRDLYLDRGWAENAWTWHEAADVRIFKPLPEVKTKGDLVWVGNWGDNERTEELKEFLMKPVKQLGLKATVHGVRYPKPALTMLKRAGIKHQGWVPNFEVPDLFAAHKVTVHVPRRPYVRKLPGIPTIRVFEALACGIPLVSAPWNDSEGLFTPGTDFLVAKDGKQMRQHLEALVADKRLRRKLGEHGRQTILAKHTCGHRADELLRIVAKLRGGQRGATATPASAVHPVGRGLPAASAAALAATPTTRTGPRVAFFGSSIVSSYWNGAATYYRGILGALARRGCRITFYEPDARDRQKHRDIEDPDWCRVVVYPVDEASVKKAVEDARGADLVVKASGVGVFDELLESLVLDLQSDTTRVAFWDVDAPATLDRVEANPHDPFRKLVPRYDLVLTYGGGPPVVKAYEALGAKRCIPIYNALDPSTHHPAQPDQRFEADLGLLANRLPDREKRIEQFFLKAAETLPQKRFILGGAGWDDKPMTPNVRKLGHVGTRDHNAFNCTPMAVLNVNRDSMARYGFSPPTRVFEAAGAGACLITDEWEGIDQFLEPGEEVLVARDGKAVATILRDLTPQRALEIGERARARMLREHTYDHRAEQFMQVLQEAGIR